jgi:methionyl-tRNA synthetase
VVRRADQLLSALDFGRPDAKDYATWWTGADERTHVIGKGILRFHAVYWPAFLLAAREPLPTHIRVHPYLTLGQLKLSKSTGTRVDPTYVASTFGTDVLRWWFCRDVAEAADTDFAVDRLITRANEDLAGGVGNVISRIVSLTHRHRHGTPPDRANPPLAQVGALPERVRSLLRAFELREAAQAIVEAVAALNQDLEATQPWNIAKNPTAASELDQVLSRHLATAQLIAEALTPIAPTLATRARHQLTADPNLPALESLIKRLELPDDPPA